MYIVNKVSVTLLDHIEMFSIIRRKKFCLSEKAFFSQPLCNKNKKKPGKKIVILKGKM